MEEWCKEVGELQAQVAALPLEATSKEMVDEKQSAVGTRIVRLIEPLKERRRILLASKEVHQVSHDLEDELVSGNGGSSKSGVMSKEGFGVSSLAFPPQESMQACLRAMTTLEAPSRATELADVGSGFHGTY